MEKEFVPYELALKLKELGFNEKCFGYHTNYQEFFYFDVDDLSSAYTKNMDNLVVNSVDGLECTAPLYQQAFRWFREKYKLQSHISPKLSYPDGFISGTEYYYSVLNSTVDYADDGVYSYEEAEIACLDKLIEIVEIKNK